MNNIILIGMPAAGKSTLGVLLAKERGMDFVDSDLVLQRREGKKLYQIMRDEGTDGFLAMEEETLCTLSLEHAVLATGGSAVYSERAMRRLLQSGLCVYLQISFDEWRRRLGNSRRRGVVLREGESLEELYAERIRLYERYAMLTIHMENESVEDTVSRLLDMLDQMEKSTSVQA